MRLITPPEQTQNSCSTPETPNELAHETSYYLQQNAYSRVKWRPWGEKSINEARDREKPIFLSIGYSTCHLCYCVDVECFADENVSQILNEWFVCIKVDGEERPDIYKVYMEFSRLLGGDRAWPVNVYLSPHDLKPFCSAPYNSLSSSVFIKRLRHVKAIWYDESWGDVGLYSNLLTQDDLMKTGALNFEIWSKVLLMSASSSQLLPQNLLSLCAEQLTSRYNRAFGGFGSATEFPRPVDLRLLFYHLKKLKEDGNVGVEKELLEMVTFTLRCIAGWGIHDHIGGGFHRMGRRTNRYNWNCEYKCWQVPHFEKMLYDQGQLASVYLDAFSFTKHSFYSCVCRDILDFIKTDMRGSGGQIYSALDADSAESEGATRKGEGVFYQWTTIEDQNRIKTEVEHILGELATLFMDHYNVQPSGNCIVLKRNEYQGKNVLIDINDSVAMALKHGMSRKNYIRILETCRKKLSDARSRRPKPHLDDTVIVSWNGLAISSFARASKILKGEAEGTKFYFPVSGCDPEEYIEVAEKAASFIKHKLYMETRMLPHSSRIGRSTVPGFLDDYAFLISGLLDLYECGGGIEWLIWAIELQKTQDELFFDKEGGGYFHTPYEDPLIIVRVKEIRDAAEPSGNSISVINIVRLASMFAGIRSCHYRKKAEDLLAVFETQLEDKKFMKMPMMCCAADMVDVSLWEVVVLVGNKKTSAEFKNMLSAAHASYNPNRTVIHIDPTYSEDLQFWEENNSEIAALAKDKFAVDKVVALVCKKRPCSGDIVSVCVTNTPGSLKDILSHKRRPFGRKRNTYARSRQVKVSLS